MVVGLLFMFVFVFGPGDVVLIVLGVIVVAMEAGDLV